MNPPNRWQEVKKILYAALELDPAERSSFLDGECHSDQELRREIESLMDAHDHAEKRFESPALDVMAAAVPGEEPDEMIGRSFAHYRIVQKIGSGGMGDVYLANDTRLRRNVAVKFLPAYFTQNKDRVRRFQQEARAASALNHPNILTIHEIGQDDSTHYITTEFVDGETLRERMGRGGLKLAETLDIAVQVASALAAANEAGIVHRDIKPENIMIRRDEIAKVLDFGLAKLTERAASDSDASTMVNTDEGVVMGTAQYMSPEQARGLKVDARTDIWSLGCVLYEMVAGRPPFTGPTSSDVIVSILEREPAPLARVAPDAPRELQRIITKTLAKDPEKRYQSVKDLLLDLKYLRDEVQFEAKLEHSARPSARTGAVTEVMTPVERTFEPTSRTGEMSAQRQVSSAEYLVGQIKQHKKRIAIAALGAVAILAVVGFGGIRLLRSYWGSDASKQSAAPLQSMKITRLTNTGKASQAVISPDGRYVVHVSSQGGQQHLRVRQVNTSSDVQIVPPAEVEYRGLTFSRDGDFVFYVVSDKNNPQPTLYQVPVLGGNPRRLISNVAGPVTFSPDGKRLAFIRQFTDQGEEGLMTANVDGSGERRIAVRKFPNFFTSASWSPDGTAIACGAGSYVPVYSGYVVQVPAEGGSEKPITSQSWTFVGQVEWLHDGSGLIVAASEAASAGSDSSQIWFLPRQGGEVRRITNDLNNYSGASLTADSGRLVTVQSGTVSNIWLIRNGEAGSAEAVTTGAAKRDGKDGVVWTPNGKTVYVSRASGTDDIWIMNTDGGGQTQLTSGAGINTNPSVSPDGRFIVFTSTRDGAAHIWRMDIDGANAKQLTSGSGENHAQFSPDGKWVVYTLFAGKPTLWRVSIEGGAPSPISDKTLSEPSISPDGTMIAAIYRDEQPNSPARIAVIPFEGGDVVKTFDVQRPAWGNVRWSRDGKALTYVATAGDVSNIWSQNYAGGEPKQLTDFKADQLFWFDWSGDGKQIISARGAETNDAVLVSNFR